MPIFSLFTHIHIKWTDILVAGNGSLLPSDSWNPSLTVLLSGCIAQLKLKFLLIFQPITKAASAQLKNRKKAQNSVKLLYDGEENKCTRPFRLSFASLVGSKCHPQNLQKQCRKEQSFVLKYSGWHDSTGWDFFSFRIITYVTYFVFIKHFLKKKYWWRAPLYTEIFVKDPTLIWILWSEIIHFLRLKQACLIGWPRLWQSTMIS